MRDTQESSLKNLLKRSQLLTLAEIVSALQKSKQSLLKNCGHCCQQMTSNLASGLILMSDTSALTLGQNRSKLSLSLMVITGTV